MVPNNFLEISLKFHTLIFLKIFNEVSSKLKKSRLKSQNFFDIIQKFSRIFFLKFWSISKMVPINFLKIFIFS